MEEEKIVKSLKTVTDRLDKLDALMGGGLELHFRCASSGKFFPGDYIAEWGRKYGIGLGKQPVSECLYTMYEMKPAIPASLRNVNQIMYPVGNHYAQVDAHFLPKGFVNGGSAILMIDDPFMIKRAEIIREKQIKNPNRLLASIVATKDQKQLTK